MPKFYDKQGFCTSYAHACGYLDAAKKNDDPQYITMGAEGAVYFVKARIRMPIVWDTFERNGEGRKLARKRFMELVKQEKAERFKGYNRD
jgi:hypothetical protein